VSLEKRETNTRVLWSWKDFPVYKYNEIPFDTHLARSHILILSASFSSRNGVCFKFHWKGSITAHIYGKYSYKDVLYLGPLKKIDCWNIVSIALFCSELFVTSHNIHLTQYIDKSCSVKQIWARVLLKLNIKVLFGIKHIKQMKRYVIRRQMNVCKFVCFYFKFQYYFKDSNACVTFPRSRLIYSTQFSRTNYKSKITKSNAYPYSYYDF